MLRCVIGVVAVVVLAPIRAGSVSDGLAATVADASGSGLIRAGSVSDGLDQAGDPPKVKLTKEEERILELTNAARKKEGLEPVTLNPQLVEAARLQAQAMAKARKFAYEIDGVGPKDRLKTVGYDGAGWGMNIQQVTGKATDAAEKAVQSWMKTDTTRETLLKKEFTEIGVGAATNAAGEAYFTQVFGVPRK
jgi:uncharacterized protein YkwD